MGKGAGWASQESPVWVWRVGALRDQAGVRFEGRSWGSCGSVEGGYEESVAWVQDWREWGEDETVMARPGGLRPFLGNWVGL